MREANRPQCIALSISLAEWIEAAALHCHSRNAKPNQQPAKQISAIKTFLKKKPLDDLACALSLPLRSRRWFPARLCNMKTSRDGFAKCRRHDKRRTRLPL